MFTFILFNICFGFVSLETLPECLRVVGGTVTNIAKYPSSTAILQSNNLYYLQICGGTIINERHVLTVAHCFINVIPDSTEHEAISIDPRPYRIRVGSSTAHFNGYTHDISNIILHPNWNVYTYDCDIAIIHTDSNIVYRITVQPAILADTNYQLYDNEPVWAIGWGLTAEGGQASEKLRHVQTWAINQSTCKELYKNYYNITDNMLCSGCIEFGGRDHCTRDSGSPIYHRGTIVGISSIGLGCGLPQYPGINVRISRFNSWIQANVEIEESATITLKKEDTALQVADIKIDIRITMDLGTTIKIQP